MFPYTYSGPAVSQHLNDSFPEVADNSSFGHGVKDLKMKASFSTKNVQSPIKLTKKDGIRFENTILNFDLMASNETVKDQNVATFEISMNADINFTMTNWVFFGSIPKVQVNSVKMTHSNYKIYPRDFEMFF